MEISIAIELDTAHKTLISSLNLQSKAQQDNSRAKKMESVLSYLKNLNDTPPKNSIEAAMYEEAQSLLKQVKDILNTARSGAHLLTSSKMFWRAHTVATSNGADDIFEEELAAILTAIEQNATGQTAGIAARLVGNQSANVLDNVADDLVKDVMTKFQQRLVSKSKKKTNEDTTYIGPVARSGKADVQGFDINYTGVLNPKWEELYTLFKGCSFSVKNYRSNTSQSTIHLGNTDIYKAFFATMSSINKPPAWINKIFYDLMNRYVNGEKNVEQLQHFNHVRFIYELQGPGLYDTNGNKINGVDFFIYNDPASPLITVESTAQMILDQLDPTKAFAIVRGDLGAIVIPKSRYIT